jgi:hypothetical protein
MKKINIKLLTLALVASASLSCVNDDDTYGNNEGKSTASTTVTSLELTEGETSQVIPFTISKPIAQASQFKILLTGGNLTADDISAGDQTIDADTGVTGTGFEITVPAYATSFDIPVQAILDIQPEGVETTTLNISAGGTRTILTKNGGYNVNLTVNNTATEELGIILEWDGEYSYEFLNGDIIDGAAQTEITTESYCDHIDFDLLISPGIGGSNYVAGTADCPEISLQSGILADGTYTIFADLYSIDTEEDADDIISTFDMPYKLTIGKTGTFVTEVSYEAQFDSTHPQSVDAAFTGIEVAVVIEVVDGKYTVYDADGELLAAE